MKTNEELNASSKTISHKRELNAEQANEHKGFSVTHKNPLDATDGENRNSLLFALRQCDSQVPALHRLHVRVSQLRGICRQSSQGTSLLWMYVARTLCPTFLMCTGNDRPMFNALIEINVAFYRRNFSFACRQIQITAWMTTNPRTVCAALRPPGNEWRVYEGRHFISMQSKL